MNNKFIISLGLKDKDTKKQKINTWRASRLLQKLLKLYNIDATVYKAKGIYTHANGKQVKENTLRLEIYFQEDNKILNFCNVLKTTYNQETIAFEKVAVNSSLVWGGGYE